MQQPRFPDARIPFNGREPDVALARRAVLFQQERELFTPAGKILTIKRRCPEHKCRFDRPGVEIPAVAKEQRNVPEQIAPARLGDYLDVMTRAVFQTGLSWSSIGNRWDGFLQAFDGFDCALVAAYTEFDVDRLMHDPGILHSARKIRATIANAQKLLELDAAHGSFANYLRSFSNYKTLASDIRKNFKFMGEMNVWYFLFRVCEPVPKFEGWVKTIPGDHPRMKEMVERGRAAGTSTELSS